MNTKTIIDRRDFIRDASLAGMGLIITRGPSPAITLGGSPSEKVVVAVMGLNGRGMVLARNFARSPNTEVAYLCDVDATVLAKAQGELQRDGAKAAKGIADFRRALDD